MRLPNQNGIMPSATRCIGAITKNGKICANFPLIGSACIPVPGVPAGIRVQICCDYAILGGPHLKCCATVMGRKYCIHPV